MAPGRYRLMGGRQPTRYVDDPYVGLEVRSNDVMIDQFGGDGGGMIDLGGGRGGQVSPVAAEVLKALRTGAGVDFKLRAPLGLNSTGNVGGGLTAVIQTTVERYTQAEGLVVQRPAAGQGPFQITSIKFGADELLPAGQSVPVDMFFENSTLNQFVKGRCVSPGQSISLTVQNDGIAAPFRAAMAVRTNE